MESKTKNKKTREQIERMTLRAFNGMGVASSGDAIVELKQGWFNAAYNIRLADSREVILKIAPPPNAEVMLYEKNIITTEVSAMRLVKQNPAIPAPEIYFFDQTRDLCDSDYFFMGKIYGENLEHARPRLLAEAQERIDIQIGNIIREVNTFCGSYFGYDGNVNLRGASWKETFGRILESVLEDAARKQVQFDFGYDEIRSAFQNHAPALDEVSSPCLVHWDAWDPNFFVQNENISGVLDFERALWADPLMEAQFRQFGGEVTHAMRGYGKTSFTFAEEQRKRLYDLHLALVMHVECFYRNYDTDAVFNGSRNLIRITMEWLKNTK